MLHIVLTKTQRILRQVQKCINKSAELWRFLLHEEKNLPNHNLILKPSLGKMISSIVATISRYSFQPNWWKISESEGMLKPITLALWRVEQFFLILKNIVCIQYVALKSFIYCVMAASWMAKPFWVTKSIRLQCWAVSQVKGDQNRVKMQQETQRQTREEKNQCVAPQ